MKKEESKVIAQKLQKIPNGTLALKHCRAGGTGSGDSEAGEIGCLDG